MMNISAFPGRPLLISLLGHCVVLGIFAFSFSAGRQGNGLQPELSPLIYCGLLEVRTAWQPHGFTGDSARRALRAQPGEVAALAGRGEGGALREYYLKPSVLEASAEKKTLLDRVPVFGMVPQQKEPVLFFHPLLPYQLQLYFKDRQEVHIELQFKIHGDQDRSAIEIKRKISSGNIEADLLSLRYISHYLFIRQGGFQTDQWHPVRVDLSTAQ